MGSSSTGAGGRDTQPESKNVDGGLKPDSTSNADTAKPFGPPARPGQQCANAPGDYFSAQHGSLNLEPNPFEQSFGGNNGAGAPETSSGTKLPSVAALTSPSSLLPGSSTTPFPWGPNNSLRSGPLSPAMLSGPTADYFGDSHIGRGFPTPNESSMRTGLTPGGSGTMFPAPSPNTTALLSSFASSGSTPGTIDFHRTAISAVQRQNQHTSQPLSSATSEPQEIAINGTATAPPVKPDPKIPFDPHDNDAANGLFMLRNGAQPPCQSRYSLAPQQPVQLIVTHTGQQAPSDINGHESTADGHRRGVSEAAASVGSDESDHARSNTRVKGKRNSAGTAANGRRKAEELSAKAPAAKKARANGSGVVTTNGHFMSDEQSDDEDDANVNHDDFGFKGKMMDDEKRKNFLERNRVAALKCRQRKKQWLQNLQTKVELFTQENDSLNAQVSQLREEVVNLKTLLLAHKDCPITQQQGLQPPYLQQTMEQFNPQLNPYGMAASIPNQAVMAGQPAGRRFS